ncbi:hypothetical protein H0O02_01235 [Candidatus Micrarchaeota archaeon]|nr:hypothetical protein [Candidatus Micrarchaeota archaeon]
MGIDKLTSSLLKEAGEEAAKIVEAAEWHVKKMREDAHSSEAALKSEAEKEVSKLLAEQRNERLAWARLEAKRVTSEAREDAINNAIEDIFSSLKEIKKSKEYRDFLSRGVSDAVKELSPAQLRVHVASEDKNLLPKLPADCKVHADLDALGGAIIETQDGKMRVDMTLETLLEHRRDDVRKLISAELFGDEKKK